MRPPEKDAADAQENTSAEVKAVNTREYSSPVLAALSLFRNIIIVSEARAERLLRGRSACIEVKRGLPVVGWRTERGRFIPARIMARELGQYAVRVPGKSEPVWLLEWSFDPEQFLATYGGLSDEKLQRQFPGFSRAAYDVDLEQRRKRDDELIAALEFGAEARDA